MAIAYLTVMNVAISNWNGRISPVFDSATRVCIVERQADTIVAQSELALPEDSVAKVRTLVDARVTALICGAISQAMRLLCAQAGIEVWANRCGEIDAVIEAFAADRLDESIYQMPGCCGRRRQRRGQCGGRRRHRYGQSEQGAS